MDIKALRIGFIERMCSSDFVRHTFLLSSGTFIAQLIPLLLTPVLSRHFSPEHFGIYAVFFAISSILSLIVNGRYEQAVMIVKEEDEAIALHKVSFLFSLIFSALLLFIVTAIWFFNIKGNFVKQIGWHLFLVPFAAFLGGMILNGNIGLNRKSYYKQISVSKVLSTLFANVLPLIFILIIQPQGSVLIICWLIGQSIAVVYFVWCYHIYISSVFIGISWYKAKMMIYKFKEFPLIYAPFSMLDVLGSSLPIFFISSFFGIVEVGHFNMANRIISIPSVFITAAIAQVFFQKVTSYLHESKPVKKLVLNTFLILLLVGIIPFLTLVIAGQPLFSFFFGSQWQRAGWFVQILSVSAILRFAVAPLSNLFVAARKIKILSAWQLSYFIMNLIVIGIGYLFKRIDLYLYVYIAGDIIMYSIYLALLLRIKIQN